MAGKKKTTSTKATLTIEEAAEMIGIGRATAYGAARSGELPTVRFGKRIFVPRAALERILNPGDAQRKASA